MSFPPVLAACPLILSSLLALGQQAPSSVQQSAAIVGTVVDLQHDVIPSATVTLDSSAPSDHSRIPSDEDGLFSFRNLRPGIPYRLTITAKGFADWTSPEIILETGRQRDLGDIELKIAVVQTTVTAMTTEQIATQEVHVEEKQRVIGVFPNFYVTYDPHPVALTSKLKFDLAFKSTIDPINFLGTAAFAGFNQAGDTPDYQQGAKGYAERFGAGYADGFTDIMIGGAILPSLLHQDPRYFYQGTGTVKSRIGHTIVFAVFCKGDNGRWQFNYSSVGGDLASGAISNLYYPPSNRGAGIVFTNALLSAGGRVADNLAQEFVFRHWTPTARKHQ